MGAIDKIYGTKTQYKELRLWIKDNYPDAGKYIYIYPNFKEITDDQIIAISNFPWKIDEKLLKKCPLKWVTDRIKEQYCI